MRVIMRQLEGELCTAEVKYACSTVHPECLLFGDAPNDREISGLYLDLGTSVDGTNDCAFVMCHQASADNMVGKLFKQGTLEILELVSLVCPDREEYYDFVNESLKRAKGF